MPRLPISKKQRPNSRTLVHRSRLRLETLETRVVPSIFMVTNTDDSGPGSLRQAILDANADTFTDTIAFNIGGGRVQTIQPHSALPTITNHVVIDGTTQPGYAGTPLIVLNGSMAGPGSDGLTLTAGFSTVQALVINGFGGNGIDLQSNGNDLIAGNYIGTEVTGMMAVANGAIGVSVTSNNNWIGGTAAGAGNLISGNTAEGIRFSASNGNVLQGNRIGTNIAGTRALPNLYGVSFRGGNDNTVGGTVPQSRNLISGNRATGVDIGGDVNNIVIVGNYIGTDIFGRNPVGNTHGIGTFGNANHITIGGTTSGSSNLISGNMTFGIDLTGGTGDVVQGNLIGTDLTGANALGNGAAGVFIEGIGTSGNTIGGTLPHAGNLISGNSSYGIDFLGTSADVVEGNLIGTDLTGTGTLHNGSGVFIQGGLRNTIGGTVSGVRNVISGNSANGIYVLGGADNLIAGNFVGTDVSGSRALGNAQAGIFLQGSTRSITGGTVAGARNVISANVGMGVQTLGDMDSQIEGNYIGTDVTGTLALGNHSDGVFIQGLSQTTIGGTIAGAGNLISGNSGNGVHVLFAGANVVAGNDIGVNAAGTAAIPNGGNGIALENGAVGNIIGGTTAASRNVISGNVGEGIRIYDNSSGTGHNSILGNYIGTNAAGTAAIGNHNSGIFIPFSQDNTIFGNLVSGNLGFAGIAVCAHSPCGGLTSNSGNASGNLITGNKVGTDVNGTVAVPNAGYGISIDGVGGTGIVVGGLTPAARNVISGNGSNGVYFLNNAMASVVEGNYIGTIASGAGPLPNHGDGVQLNYGSNNTIGGTSPGAGNLISGNSGAGVRVLGTLGLNNSIEGNLIGTDVFGERADPNTVGIYISGNSTTVGGTLVGAGNLISGNAGTGVYISGEMNKVAGNLIGTDATGAQALGNAVGVAFDFATPPETTSGNTVGGTIASARNVISGNAAYGVDLAAEDLERSETISNNYIGTGASGSNPIPNGAGIFGGGAHSMISGNLISANRGPALLIVRGEDDGGGVDTVTANIIGTDVSGTFAMGNMMGISIQGAIGNVISRNLISGNNGDGITISGSASINNRIQGNFIGTDGTGTIALPNHGNGISITVGGRGITVGGTGTSVGNIISGNTGAGIAVAGPGNLIQGNYIGVDASASIGLPNAIGIDLETGTSNTIGGIALNAGNIISGNRGDGIDLNSNNNIVQGNLIGTDSSGTVAVPNGFNGILIFSGANNLIGGTAQGAGNVVSGNVSSGIVIGYDGRANGNVLQGNLIGTDISGSVAIPNGDGIALVGGSQNLIGGTIAGAGNLISGNERGGLYVGSSDPGNVVEGNLIGTDINGTAPLGNGYGLFFFSGANVQIIGNAISGNLHDGIYFDNGFVTGNVVQGNLIGIDASGTVPLGNGDNGIHFVNDSLLGAPHDDLIGGTTPGAGNLIAYNGHDGILVDTGTGNTILRNRILGHDNGLGIELVNGGNNNQAFPIITSAFFDGTFTTIAGTLASAPNTTYTIELFVNSVCNPSGFGEGEHFFASITVATDANGNASFDLSLPIEVDPGQYISATATDSAGDTSQFAACVVVTGPGFPRVLPPIMSANSGQGGLAVTQANPPPASPPGLILDRQGSATPPPVQVSEPLVVHESSASDGWHADPFADLLYQLDL